MASITKRGKSYCVVYTYVNEFGETKQKWESFKTSKEAKGVSKQLNLSRWQERLLLPENRLWKSSWTISFAYTVNSAGVLGCTQALWRRFGTMSIPS